MKWWTVSIIKQPCFVMQISYFCLLKPSRKTHSASEHPVLSHFLSDDWQSKVGKWATQRGFVNLTAIVNKYVSQGCMISYKSVP